MLSYYLKDKDHCLMGIGSREGHQQCESEEEGECEETVTNHLTEATTSATEWMGVTTNSDECSYRWILKYCYEINYIYILLNLI